MDARPPASVLLLCVLLVGGCTDQPRTLEEVKARTRAKYPRVEHVEPREAVLWLADGGEPVILLDVREPAEFAVSHLPGAVRVDPGATADEVAAALRGVAKDARIVTYCSVGERSAAMAARLGEAGYVNVANMTGSIFQWANEGRPLEQHDGEPAQKVHPFDARWGKLLDAQRRADVE